MIVGLKDFLARQDKNLLVVKLTCLVWLSEKLICWRMWTLDRILPAAPYLKFLDHVPAGVHLCLLGASLILMLLFVFTGRHLLLILLLVSELFSCLLDQNRVQPWEYQFGFMAFIFLVNKKRPELVLPMIGFLLASTYFYSGLCKFNEGFLDIFWSKTMLRNFFRLPLAVVNRKWVFYCGYILGAIEMLSGLGLLFASTRFKAALVLIGMHVFIFWLLGPFGLGGHKSLWPWNLAMMFFLYFIFIRKSQMGGALASARQGANKLVLICWGILPLLSFFGYWDKYLSSNMYSANVPRMVICIADTSKSRPLRKFYNYYRNAISFECSGQANIDLQQWAVWETRTTISPEPRVYKIIQDKLEKQFPEAGLSFVYLDR